MHGCFQSSQEFGSNPGKRADHKSNKKLCNHNVKNQPQLLMNWRYFCSTNCWNNFSNLSVTITKCSKNLFWIIKINQVFSMTFAVHLKHLQCNLPDTPDGTHCTLLLVLMFVLKSSEFPEGLVNLWDLQIWMHGSHHFPNYRKDSCVRFVSSKVGTKIIC